MKTNLISVFLLLLISGCSSPKYLPVSDDIDVATHGAFIKMIRDEKPTLAGELIAIDTATIYYISDKTKSCDSVRVKEFDHFILKYAKPPQYGWAIPAGVVLPFIHGLVSYASLPVHLIVTISVVGSGENAFKYSDENLSFEKLHWYARFPQGIPPGIKPNDIH
ncbi:MAG: hypothetical protein LCH54_02755 [Bacteroidetes bacterium]|nr:hypothetical protein [Bacteroidota bacterium]